MITLHILYYILNYTWTYTLLLHVSKKSMSYVSTYVPYNIFMDEL